ncbi:MAG: c-type cytochrome biogenesis protein CcsB [Propionibacteriaceae bacterium]|nr:c-type cytochrome biogenesis protein CcsB [Propionibacteriaceae bacterium]
MSNTATLTPPTAKKSINVGTFAHGFTVAALAALSVYIILRIVVTGHGPFSNQHEFAVSFVWGILAAYLIAQWRLKVPMMALIVLPIATGMMIYALLMPRDIESLNPALQNGLLLTIHVGLAMLAYGAACVSFGAAVLYLIHPLTKMKTSLDTLDEIGYKAAVITFPLLTIMILMGALWANTAWGRYWGWDPKEVAALVTWLMYGAFLHARVARGWRGVRCAWLLVIGFALVMFAFFGNHFFGGLHSYM